MKTKLAIIEHPDALTKKQGKSLQKIAKKRLGRKFRVLVVSGGAHVRIEELEQRS